MKLNESVAKNKYYKDQINFLRYILIVLNYNCLIKYSIILKN